MQTFLANQEVLQEHVEEAKLIARLILAYQDEINLQKLKLALVGFELAPKQKEN
jgi:hypothetical protein